MANYGLSYRVALVPDHRVVRNIDPLGQLPNGRLGAIDDPTYASPIVTILEGKFRPSLKAAKLSRRTARSVGNW